jgi:hypothetical protein
MKPGYVTDILFFLCGVLIGGAILYFLVPNDSGADASHIRKLTSEVSELKAQLAIRSTPEAGLAEKLEQERAQHQQELEETKKTLFQDIEALQRELAKSENNKVIRELSSMQTFIERTRGHLKELDSKYDAMKFGHSRDIQTGCHECICSKNGL